MLHTKFGRLITWLGFFCFCVCNTNYHQPSLRYPFSEERSPIKRLATTTMLESFYVYQLGGRERSESPAVSFFFFHFSIRAIPGAMDNAFFIQEWAKNRGDYVSKPPHISDRGNRCWLTLDAAIDACKTHSKQYEPSASIKRRAAEILNSYREAA